MEFHCAFIFMFNVFYLRKWRILFSYLNDSKGFTKKNEKSMGSHRNCIQQIAISNFNESIGISMSSNAPKLLQNRNKMLTEEKKFYGLCDGKCLWRQKC